MSSWRPVLLIAGIAEGLGASIAATFADAGYDVLGLARSRKAEAGVAGLVEKAGGTYTHLCCDLTEAADVAAALRPHAGGIRAAIHNAQRLLIKPLEQTDLAEFEDVWRVNCLGAVTVAQNVLPHMTAAGRGTIVLTGATASRRGAAKFAAFASAKFALRGLAQSMAREYGPAGIHVAHVVIDSLVDEPQTEQRFGPATSRRMNPDAVARAYLNLIEQDSSCWTHELDLRPSSERF